MGLRSYVAEKELHVPEEQLVLELLVVHRYPLGSVREYEQLESITTLWELPSPENVDGLGEHPETVMV